MRSIVGDRTARGSREKGPPAENVRGGRENKNGANQCAKKTRWGSAEPQRVTFINWLPKQPAAVFTQASFLARKISFGGMPIRVFKSV